MERGYGQGSNTIKVRGHLGSAKEVNDQMCVIHLGFILSEEAGCCEVKREKSNSSINEIGFDIDQTCFLGSHGCDFIGPSRLTASSRKDFTVVRGFVVRTSPNFFGFCVPARYKSPELLARPNKKHPPLP